MRERNPKVTQPRRTVTNHCAGIQTIGDSLINSALSSEPAVARTCEVSSAGTPRARTRNTCIRIGTHVLRNASPERRAATLCSCRRVSQQMEKTRTRCSLAVPTVQDLAFYFVEQHNA